MENSDFLAAAYGELQDCYGWITSFRADPNQTDVAAWGGHPWLGSSAQCELIDQRVEDNNFFCVATMRSPDRKRRSKEVFERLAVLMADDADPDDLVAKPSYIIETSPNNYQIGIFLDPEDPDTFDRDLIDGVLQRMAAESLIKADSSGNNVVRYGRLPTGSNTKARAGGNFRVRVVEMEPEYVYSLADATGAFGIDLDDIREQIKNRPAKAELRPMDVSDEAALYRMMLHPNPDERSYHEPLLRLSAKMLASGMFPGAVVNSLRAMGELVKPDREGPELDRWRHRFGSELSRMVAGAEKYAPDATPIEAGKLFSTFSEVLERTQNVSWIVKNLVPADSMGMIFGASGAYKSFLAIDMALHVSHGLEWAGNRTKPGSVAYMAAEGGSGIARRILAWHRKFGIEPPENLRICTTPLLLSAEDEVAMLKREIAGLDEIPSVIIIDTLSQTFNGDENSASDVGAYLRLINSEIRAGFNATVIVVHHTGHNAIERPRGSSALTANLDFVLGVFKPDPEMMQAKLIVTKMKDGDRLEDMYFDLSRLVLGVDQDGDEVSSLIAEHNPDVAGTKADTGKTSAYDAAILMLLNKRPATIEEIYIAAAKVKPNTRDVVTRGVKRRLEKMKDARLICESQPGIWAKQQ